MPCGLFKWKWDRKQAERRAVAAIRELSGWVVYDWQDDGKDTPPGPAWLRAILGDDFFAEVEHVKTNSYPNFDIVHLHALKRLQSLWFFGDGLNQFSDADFTFLTEMNDLEEIGLMGVHFTDAGVSTIKEMRRLTKLRLNDSEITDSGLEELSHVAALEELGLAGSRISDSGLVHLQALLALHELDLRGTSITYAGLVHLKKLNGLTYLGVNYTQISPKGMVELQNALPNCTVGLAPPEVLPPESGDVGIEESNGDHQRDNLDCQRTEERIANP